MEAKVSELTQTSTSKVFKAKSNWENCKEVSSSHNQLELKSDSQHIKIPIMMICVGLNMRELDVMRKEKPKLDMVQEIKPSSYALKEMSFTEIDCIKLRTEQPMNTPNHAKKRPFILQVLSDL